MICINLSSTFTPLDTSMSFFKNIILISLIISLYFDHVFCILCLYEFQTIFLQDFLELGENHFHSLLEILAGLVLCCHSPLEIIQHRQ